MQTFTEAFQLGGYGMYVLTLLALFTYPLSVGALILSTRASAMSSKLAAISLGLDVFVTIVGMALYLHAMSIVNEAVAHIEAAQRTELLEQGRYEASMLIYGTGCTVALPFILSGIALLIGASRRRVAR